MFNIPANIPQSEDKVSNKGGSGGPNSQDNPAPFATKEEFEALKASVVSLSDTVSAMQTQMAQMKAQIANLIATVNQLTQQMSASASSAAPANHH